MEMAPPPGIFIVLRAFNELILLRRGMRCCTEVLIILVLKLCELIQSAIAGVFTNGGAKPNIIPEEAALQFYVRAPKMAELLVLKEKIIKCFEGAAQATGCEVSLVSLLAVEDLG